MYQLFLSSLYDGAMQGPILTLQIQGGVTHVFVNLGSDHPSILEAMVKGQKEKRDQFPTIITCPNEVRQQLHHATYHAALRLASVVHRYATAAYKER
jgi:hypothetical protein